MKPSAAAGGDWASLHERLERVRREVERLTDPGPAVRREILRERAQALARADAPGQPAHAAGGADDGDSIEVIEFKAGGERYAVQATHVAQVHPIMPITPLPGVPVFIAGIVAPQGE